MATDTAIAIIILCACICFGLVILLLQARSEVSALKVELSKLQRQLNERNLRQSSDGVADGLLEKAVAGLVGLGVPGLVLLAALGASGFAGAAAITTGLASLGGPLGMVGGVGTLVLLGLVSKSVTKHGLPRVAELVVRGLLKNGHSRDGIRATIDRYPRWLVSGKVRRKVDGILAGRA